MAAVTPVVSVCMHHLSLASPLSEIVFLAHGNSWGTLKKSPVSPPSLSLLSPSLAESQSFSRVFVSVTPSRYQISCRVVTFFTPFVLFVAEGLGPTPSSISSNLRASILYSLYIFNGILFTQSYSYSVRDRRCNSDCSSDLWLRNHNPLLGLLQTFLRLEWPEHLRHPVSCQVLRC